MTLDEVMVQLCQGAAGISPATQAALIAQGAPVFTLESARTAPNPKIVLTLISGPNEYTQDGDANLTHPRFQVNCYAATAELALALRKAVSRNISGFRGVVGGSVRVGGIFLENRHSFDFPSAGSAVNAERGYSLDAVVWGTE